MVTFLFWNLNQKPIVRTVAKIAEHYCIDVLMLAECTIPPTDLLTTLNPTGKADYHYAPGYLCHKIQIFSRFSADFISPLFESDRLTVRHLTLPGHVDILLAISHFPSKLYWSNESQALECVALADSIRQVENRAGHSRTILVGDLNMNPFEDGIVSAIGLNATMARSIAKRHHRVVQMKKYPFFYNPMWGLLGDNRSGSPGTYYYASSEHKAYFWNMFDQVLVRPGLLDGFDSNDLCILDSDGEVPLSNAEGLPDSKNFSDHLPILFKLAL
jgi:hypothetical protein